MNLPSFQCGKLTVSTYVDAEDYAYNQHIDEVKEKHKILKKLQYSTVFWLQQRCHPAVNNTHSHAAYVW